MSKEENNIKRSNIELPKNIKYNSIRDNGNGCEKTKRNKKLPAFLIVIIIMQILLGGLIWFGAYHFLDWS